MILIMLTYYNRPMLLHHAINSVLSASQHYSQWHLVIGDDNSPVPAEPIVRELARSHLSQIDFVRTDTSLEEKLAKGTCIGRYANQYLESTLCDIVITLGDDDRLHPAYLRDLARFYEHKTDVMYAYSDIEIYNPLMQGGTGLSHRYNVHLGDRNPSGLLDASQVSFRHECFREHGIRFPEWTAIGNAPYAGNIDAPLYDQLYQKFGTCAHTGLLGQYKGVHDYQLVWHKKKGSEGVRNYIEIVNELGGKVF